MKAEKKQRLEREGWRIGSAEDFLGLTDDEAAVVELKLRLAKWLRARRVAHKWSQVEFAKRVGSSQSRIAKLEAGDPSISLDMLFRCAFAAGASRAELGTLVAARNARRERPRA